MAEKEHTMTIPESDLRDRLRAWSENSPDPDFFNSDVLSAVLADCGEAAAALAAALPHLGEPVVRPDHPLSRDSLLRVLNDCSQLIGGVKGQWQNEGAWSDWDQEVCDEISTTLAALYAARAEDRKRATERAQATESEPLYAAPHPAPATLGEIMAEAKARFNALTPEQQEAEMREQRESWARGEAAMGSDADEAREREAYRTRLAAADPVSDPRVRAVVEAVRNLIPLLPISDSSVPTRSAQDWDYRQAKANLRHAIDALPTQSEAK